MSIIEITNFSQGFGEKQLFNNTSFVLNKGEKIGLTGVNGAGKSTLLKIIMGEVLLDEGTRYVNNKFNIKYLDQHAEVKGEKNIFEYLKEAYQHLFDTEEKLNKVNEELGTATDNAKIEKLLNQSGDLFEYLTTNNFYSIESEIEKVCAGLGIMELGLDSKVKTLSGGQRAKVMLAKLLLESPDVMVLDEPTNFLDVSHIEWLTKFIKNSEQAFIIVSHDLKFLDDVVTHICDVDNKEISKYTGSYSKMAAVKEEKRRLLEKSYESQQKEIKRLEDYIAKNKARAATAKMAHSREKAIERMDIIDPPSEQMKPTFSFKVKPFMGNLMVKLEKLEVGYKKPLLQPINLEINYKERVAITGFNGIGKSTLLKTILGKLSPIHGSSTICKNVVVGYYEQENDFRNFEGTPLNYITQFYPKLSDKEIRSALSKCGLNSGHCKKQIKQLSGGEQSKIKICLLILSPCNLLILDEPTNHLDVFAINRLKEAIAEFDGSVIFVSHNKQFVSEVATKVYNLEKMSI